MTTRATSDATTMDFEGFTKDAVQFLAHLADHNDRAWFQPRKPDYERLLKRPLEALCLVLDRRFREQGIPLSADPTRSPFRIYRDVRFSKDKAPYKTQVAASFPWIEDDAQPSHTGEGGNPGGYFHFAPGEVFMGGGMWHPPAAKLAAFRAEVARDARALHAILDEPEFNRRFGGVSGDMLRRVPSGYPADHPEAELLKHRDVTFGQRLSDADALSPALPDVLADAFAAAVPLMRYLARL